MAELITTNGDVVAGSLGTARPGATVLPWRDVLHERPVCDVDAAELRAMRAAWLADGSVHTEDAVLADHARFERIELWFEHDLYDQPQLIQALDMLAELGRDDGVWLIQAPVHLGPVKPDKFGRFEDLALAVNDAMFAPSGRPLRRLRH